MKKETNTKVITPGIWSAEYDAQGNCTNVVYDLSYRKLIGYISEADYGNTQDTWTSSIHPEDSKRVDDYLAYVLKKHPEGMDYDIEYRMMTSSGYRWFHDYAHFTRRKDGTVIRCDGVVFDIQDSVDRNYITAGVLSNEGEAADSRCSGKADVNKIISAIAVTYNIAYKVNLTTDEFTLLRMDGDMMGHEKVFEKFSGAKAYFINEVLHPFDRERIANELDYDVIRQKLITSKSYNIEYRAVVKGSTLWHEMNITSVSDDEIVIGFAMKNLEITKRKLTEKRFEEYLALFVIDLDTEMIQPMKTSPLFKTAEVGEAVPYEPAMKMFAAIYEGEAKELFVKISDIGYVREALARNEKYTYAYKSSKLGDDKWIEVISYVIERHEDGTPSMFTLGFILVDSLATERQQDQARMKEDMQMISGLANEYHALYYFNVAEKFFKIYALDQERFPEVSRLVESSKNPLEVFDRFTRSDLIHPDDRHLFEDLSPEMLLQKLAHCKKFTTRFRRLYFGQYLWTEMDVIKYGDVDEPANIIAVGFAERDAEIRGEQALNNCFDILGRDLPTDEAVNDLLALAGEFYGAERCYIFEFEQNDQVISNTYEWCADGVEAVISMLQNVPATEIQGWVAEFERHGAFYMDTLDESAYSTPEGRELLEMQGIESLIAAPIMNGDKMVGFIGVDNPTLAKKNITVLTNVAVVVYSEILKRKENDEEHITFQKLADTFVSVYFADLSRDYIHTWKIADEYKDAYGVTEYYSESMGGYVRKNIAARDRRRACRMTSPQYVLRQFQKKDRFSIDMTDIMLGYERNFVFDYVKVSEDGNQLVICCRDVTENIEKEREQALSLDLANQQRHIKAFGDMVNAALWSLDINDRNEVVDVYWSNECRHMLGFTDEEDFPNVIESWSSRLHPRDKRRTLAHFANGLESRDTDKFVYDEEYRMMKKNGEYCWYHAVGRMENNEDGTRRMYGIFLDISADKQIEEQQRQLEAARLAAEAASKSKTSFLFNMSHDIRTPMNAITGFTNMAKKYANDPKRVKNYLEKIDTSGQQLLALINQVLEMARIESGKIELDNKPVNVHKEYNSMITVLAEQAKTYGLEFHHSLQDIIHSRILADQARMSSITLNITGNAMKYTPKGGRIDFMLKEIKPRKEGFATFVFTVQDTGIGMSEEYLKVLFDPFTRENNSTVNKIQGTGLGMSIVKDLVNLMGGNIDVQSKVGEGTKFDITIDFEIDRSKKVSDEREIEIDEAAFAGLKALIVEDNELNREIAIDILEEKDIRVETAEDGSVAVDIMRRKGSDYYDFILMDIQMPVMDGFAATEEIRKMYPDLKIPIIALSANAFEEDRSASISAGMSDHIAKPIHINELFRILARYIG